MFSKVEIYTFPTCPYCVSARSLLDKRGIVYADIDVSRNPKKFKEMMERSGRRTVPQVFIDGHHVGGNDDLHALDSHGGL